MPEQEEKKAKRSPRRPQNEIVVGKLKEMPLGELTRTAQGIVKADRETAEFFHGKLGDALSKQ